MSGNATGITDDNFTGPTSGLPSMTIGLNDNTRIGIVLLCMAAGTAAAGPAGGTIAGENCASIVNIL